MKRAADVAEALYSAPRAPAPLGPLAPSHPHPAVVGINAFSSPLAIAVGDATPGPEPGAPCSPGVEIIVPSLRHYLSDRHSLAGYARSCSSTSPRGFAPSPGSQQSSYGSGLGAGLGGYGAPGVASLGVPGSPSFLNGSTATSPFASECSLPAEGGTGALGSKNGASPCPLPVLGGEGTSGTCSMRISPGLAFGSQASPVRETSLWLGSCPSTPHLGFSSWAVRPGQFLHF